MCWIYLQFPKRQSMMKTIFENVEARIFQIDKRYLPRLKKFCEP